MITEKPTKTRQDMHIRLSQQVKAQLEGLANERECSLTQLVRDVLREYVDAHTDKTN